MVPPLDAAIRRRTFLAGLGGTAVLAIAATVSGCSVFGGDDTVAPSVEPSPASPDPITGLIATTRLHVLRLNAAIAADKQQAALLTQLRDDRQAHLEALEAEHARLDPSAVGPSSAASAALPPGEITVPDTPAAVIASVRGDAATAQVQFTDAISAASRYRAALYASIAACLASHRAVLA